MRALLFHALTLLLAAAFAWWAYSDQGAQEPEGRVMLNGDVAQLTGLEFSVRPGHRLLLRRRAAPAGFWLEVWDTQKPLAKTDTADRAVKLDEPQKTAYRANEEFERALDKILPLRAVRFFEDLGAEKIQEFGLDEPRGKLRLVLGDGETVYLIGKQVYGGETVYLMEQGTEKVFSVSAALIRLLDFRAPRYLDRRLLDLGGAEVDRAELICGPRGARILVAGPRAGKEPVPWAPADEPGATEDVYGLWMNRLLRTRGNAYPEQVAQPATKSSCTIRLSGKGEVLEQLQLSWEGLSDKKRQAVARSRHTGAWLRLDPYHADPLIDDLPRVLSGG